MSSDKPGDLFASLESDDDPDEEPDYTGNEGWVVVAIGTYDRACFLAVDPAFGALRFFIDEAGFDDPFDANLLSGCHHDTGIFKATAEASLSSFEGETDMVFTVTSPWTPVTWPLPGTPEAGARDQAAVEEAFAAADLVVQACGTPRPNMMRVGSQALAEKFEPNAVARACRVCAADGTTAWLGDEDKISVVGWSCAAHEKETAALLRRAAVEHT